MNPHKQDRIDTVLQALRDAEPAPGMQQRITAALHRGEQSSNATKYHWPLWVPPAVALPRLALAAVIVAAAAAFLLHARHNDRTSAADISVTHQPSGKLTAWVDAVAPTGSHKESPSALPAAIPASTPRHSRSATQVEGASRQSPAEERSFPAPPLPLTEQERLLIRLIHREAPVQLAQLTTPAINAARQQETDEVTAFFAPRVRVVEEQQAPVEPPEQGSSDPMKNPQDEANKEIQ